MVHSPVEDASNYSATIQTVKLYHYPSAGGSDRGRSLPNTSDLPTCHYFGYRRITTRPTDRTPRQTRAVLIRDSSVNLGCFADTNRDGMLTVRRAGTSTPLCEVLERMG